MSTTTEENDGVARPVGEGVDPAMEMFENTPWAQPSNADILAAVRQLEAKFDQTIETLSGIAAQIGPTIDALRENPLKFLTGKMGGK